jgi:NADH-quinone oxidoreductase subunit M
VASVGVALAAVYMIRMYQRSMHNRTGPAVESRELSRWDFGLIAPLVAVILFLGVYPQFVLSRSEGSTTASLVRAAPQAYGKVAKGWTCYAPLDDPANADVPGCPP